MEVLRQLGSVDQVELKPNAQAIAPARPMPEPPPVMSTFLPVTEKRLAISKDWRFDMA